MAPSKERLTLYGLLLAIVAVTGLGLLVGSNMSGNLFSESLSILVTVFVVDKLLRLDSERKARPAMLAAFRDAAALFREAQNFGAAAARSTVPASELGRIKGESGSSKPWLYPYLGRLRPGQDAPWGAPPPYGQGSLKWAQAMTVQIASIEKLIDRYLTRHTALSEPEITEAVHSLEENGLFRSVSYGDIFWILGDETSGQFWQSYLEKVDSLSEALYRHASKFPEVTLQPPGFNWHLLALEIEAVPVNDGKATYRPA